MSIGILTVATNKYINYWIDLVKSAERNIPNFKDINFHVFTNAENMEIIRQTDFHDAKITVHEIMDFGWPEASLLRYEIFCSHKSELTEDYLIHLDADMLFITRDLNLFMDFQKTKSMTLVSHPGFWRPGFWQRLGFYTRNIFAFISDLLLYLRFGGLGSWEINKKSSAFVKRSQRRNYVCGGVWGGERNQFVAMCELLSKRVRFDLKNQYVAKWHDESHLNWWASNNNFKLLTPRYCYEPTYKNLAKIHGLILAVDKGNSFKK